MSRAKNEALIANPADARHGTYAGYQQGCRCEPCKEANRAYHRLWYLQRQGGEAELRARHAAELQELRARHAVELQEWREATREATRKAQLEKLRRQAEALGVALVESAPAMPRVYEGVDVSPAVSVSDPAAKVVPIAKAPPPLPPSVAACPWCQGKLRRRGPSSATSAHGRYAGGVRGLRQS